MCLTSLLNDAPWLLYTHGTPFHSKPEKKARYASKTKNPAFSGMALLDENVDAPSRLDQSVPGQYHRCFYFR